MKKENPVDFENFENPVDLQFVIGLAFQNKLTLRVMMVIFRLLKIECNRNFSISSIDSKAMQRHLICFFSGIFCHFLSILCQSLGRLRLLLSGSLLTPIVDNNVLVWFVGNACAEPR